ncbi:bifunctional phosphopantothenoylcysteine decarboxylase/phosphopantothenate--cysteine ligase CoaBC [Porphyromonas catoniae]|jgi:phosphopantothenoylcysteine decarboxylase/phosphopantothenate--cysteine ligase|uniref:bifunctional phosphopantothenoylcysteine decarboxylase/phosphopantothenate--cysteine ligase CoaBC n=1 Tax=Porphyromonas catoniae TaxID=41976 RepID=UPI0028D11E17|nr:bifunctional phosphopantothenoylcysteine decarboxylase/phosphopantothenate--cysteine ligase CoaBC [Porphyromonas catoniae]
MGVLSGKHIVLGITGSIAAYKAAVLTRLLVRAGAEVQIVITPAGKEFITPITLSALSSHPVISEFFSGRDGTWNSHVDLGLWADAMLIAPASASTIGKLAHGIADNMLITTYLSMKAPVFIAPAMDLDMFAHPSTTDNLDLLAQRGNFIIEPQSGELASHLVGKGRMEEPEAIVAVLEEYFSTEQDYQGKHVLLTAGPTHEPIDPVRFIGNHSTGKMGIALANEFARRGAEVTLILGPSSLRPREEVRVLPVMTAEEMLRVAEDNIGEADIAIFAAAVADYRPLHSSQEKLKRDAKEDLQLELVRNPDIAATLGSWKRPNQYFVGFALESNAGFEEAKRKMAQKNLNAIVLNSLLDKGAGFACETNKVTLFDREGGIEAYELKSKEAVARDIVDFIARRIAL